MGRTEDVGAALGGIGEGARPSIQAGVDALQRRFGTLPDDDGREDGRPPVFLMAAGWRTGSTLLQRLLVSDGSMLVWGEPYDHSASIRRLAEMLAPFDDHWPPDRYLVEGRGDIAPDQWLANRYPHPLDFLGAHRSFLDRLFAEPARRAGFARWGVKTVRLGGDHATYLRAVYPTAPMVFLVRNPYDAFLSYRMLHDVRPSSSWWYHRWPDVQVSTPSQFGALWQAQVSSFTDVAHDLGAMFVSFESLTSGSALAEVARFVDVAVEPSTLRARVGASSEQRHAPTMEQATLSIDEIRELRAVVDPLAGDLGYAGPSARS